MCSDLCGDSRLTLDILSLLQCTDSIESHLACIHLSRETITEGARNGQRADTQLILKWQKPYTQMYGVLIQVRCIHLP